ncbi:uncharacterized protein K452DRAFT_49741 [Aplosporella prunicola CBS 121167]|uniref:Uncharacterized protein n=1 Tax=Aplosporella prunicola CBS 121167 TaxID=1176127 RepID=A0A6A6BAQ2_9PEZI|nr:uncharacterized protein K452DRAFT_49741 [Aplosporella prunicola CBS 121167]KAF2140668.1 hypothetical protein K452DRAFT_49741 [Aplosporella prunicola CBS 121167]
MQPRQIAFDSAPHNDCEHTLTQNNVHSILLRKLQYVLYQSILSPVDVRGDVWLKGANVIGYLVTWKKRAGRGSEECHSSIPPYFCLCTRPRQEEPGSCRVLKELLYLLPVLGDKPRGRCIQIQRRQGSSIGWSGWSRLSLQACDSRSENTESMTWKDGFANELIFQIVSK